MFSIDIALEALHHIFPIRKEKINFFKQNTYVITNRPKKLDISVLSHHQAGNYFIAMCNIRQRN
jgi:hypothetical protein